MFEPLSNFLKWKPPQVKEIISHGILPAGGRLVLAGKEQEFKTMLSTYAGFCISLGLPLFGFKTTQTKVCMLQAELPKAIFQDRISQLVQFHNTDLSVADIHFASELELKLNKPAGIAQLTADIQQIKPGLLIIDPLYKVISADISDWQEMLKFIDNIDYIARRFNCAIWIAHHRRKTQVSGDEIIDLGTDELIGSSALKDWADTILRVSLQSEDKLTVEFSKVRNARYLLSPVELKFNRSNLSFSLSLPDISASELKDI